MVIQGSSKFADEAIFIGRILLVTLFLVFGWSKLNDIAGTAGYMEKTGVPMPQIATWIAIVVELATSLLLILGLWTKPVAILLAVYTLAAGIIGHRYWTMDGLARYGNMINFYKNISIIGGCLLLYVTGAGRYAIDAMKTRNQKPNSV